MTYRLVFKEKTMRLNRIEIKVTDILERCPQARADDWVLLKEFYDEYIDTELFTFATMCQFHNELDLPSFESVRRCRQKIQAKRPELVDPTTAKHRRKLVEEYENYAKV